MKKIFLLLFLFIFLFFGCDTENILQNNSIVTPESSIENSDLILDEMIKTKDSNLTNSNEVLEIKNEDDLVKEKEIKEANERFKNFEENLSIVKDNWVHFKSGTSFYIQLQGEINKNKNVNVYDVDLFDTPINIINELHKKDIDVVCYFSAGSSEDWRDDFSDFPKEVLGADLNGWKGETWLDVSNFEKFSDLMIARFDLAKEKGCDAVDSDNVDGYSNENGFELTYDDQLKYNIWLSEQAHKRGLAIGLKNDLNQIEDLVNYYDFAVNEQCLEYAECNLLLPFIENEKAVFEIEYEKSLDVICENQNLGFSPILANYDLDGDVKYCK